jgi:hypothetical protein
MGVSVINIVRLYGEGKGCKFFLIAPDISLPMLIKIRSRYNMGHIFASNLEGKV